MIAKQSNVAVRVKLTPTLLELGTKRAEFLGIPIGVYLMQLLRSDLMRGKDARFHILAATDEELVSIQATDPLSSEKILLFPQP